MKKQTLQYLTPDRLALAPELEAAQRLMPMAPQDFGRLRESIAKDGIREPLDGYRHNGRIWILSGVHRLQVAKELQIKMVPVRLWLTRGEAELAHPGEHPDTLPILDPGERESFAVDANLSRRHLTTKQKGELISYLLRKHPEASNLQIAKKAGVNDKTVAARRKEESRSEIPNVEKKDSKGRRIGKRKDKETLAITGTQRKKGEQLAKEIRTLRAEVEKLETKAKEKRGLVKAKEKQLKQIAEPSLFGL